MPLTPMAFQCYSYALHVVNFSTELTLSGPCVFAYILRQHALLILYEMASYNIGLLVRPFVSWPRLCCHYCHTIELHSTITLETTPSSLAASRAIIYLALIAVSVTMFNIGTHPSHYGTSFHLIVPPYNSE
jgi:hypothetical protein